MFCHDEPPSLIPNQSKLSLCRNPTMSPTERLPATPVPIQQQTTIIGVSNLLQNLTRVIPVFAPGDNLTSGTTCRRHPRPIHHTRYFTTTKNTIQLPSGQNKNQKDANRLLLQKNKDTAASKQSTLTTRKKSTPQKKSNQSICQTPNEGRHL